MSEARLRDIARLFLRSGRLPSTAPRRIWGGPGVGIECRLCELPVTAAQQETQVEIVEDQGMPDVLRVFHFHLRCFAAWALERE